MLIDTHCHTYYSEDKNAPEILQECKVNNIKVILNGIDKKSNKEIIELSKKFNNVYAAIGYDHSVVNKITQKDIDLLESQIINENIIALGEIGLDYYYTKDNMKEQKELFIKQLDLANKYNLPVIIHCREAERDVYEILKNRNNKGSIHCFSGSIELAKKFNQIGFYIGIDGPITYKKNEYLRNMVKGIDINKILIETDSPYLSPEPVRGCTNSSLNLKYIVNQIAKVLNLSYDEVKRITSNNAIKLFELNKYDKID